MKEQLKRFYKKNIQKSTWKELKSYFSRYKNAAFEDCYCVSETQFEASITRLYHTIEKGLSYLDYRPGYGKDSINKLIKSLEQYVQRGYDTSKFFYQTALSTLYAYIDKNEKFGVIDEKLNARIKQLPGTANEYGGVISFVPYPQEKVKNIGFKNFVLSRHSIRHFSEEPVEMQKIINAIELAQQTPSACNRQGWCVKIISDKKILEQVLKNQNGNRGFGDEIDKLLLVTGDLSAFNQSREVTQVFVDGGMYAMNILHCMYYEHIGTIPLSAALSPEQEKNIRCCLKMKDSEVPILFIGLGNYPDECQTTRSERHEARYQVF